MYIMMSSVLTPLIDKKTLAELVKNQHSVEGFIGELVPLLQQQYEHSQDKIKAHFQLTRKPQPYLESNAELMDSIITVLAEGISHYLDNSPIAIIAVGGYGRKELFPFSDIDLLFLHDSENSAVAEYASRILYALWDMKCTVGQAVRSISQTLEAASKDYTIATSLLDMRFIYGNKKIFNSLQAQFLSQKQTQDSSLFVEAKLQEHDARHLRTGDSRYVLEPNIKEGKGGLRDLHTLYWLLKYIYDITSYPEIAKLGLLTPEEYRLFSTAQEFLWQLRIHLHLQAGRAEERLTFDMQHAIAEAMGYHDSHAPRAIERFMKQYFLVARNSGSLTRSICAILEENGKRKPHLGIAGSMAKASQLDEFTLELGRIALMHEEDFSNKPYLLIKLFELAHKHRLEIHPHTLQKVTRSLWLIDSTLRRDAVANQSFMNILLSNENPEPILHAMSDAGVLGKFIPDFGKVIGQMQFDMYHVYTVDEHTLCALGILHNIGAGKYREDMPLASEIYGTIKSKRVLFLAVLTHDIAKGRGGDHSVIGELIARKLARRFGFDAYEIETCAWLVRNHLVMSRTAFKRDLNDAKTIEDFTLSVQSPERLKFLFLLTVADIRAVGPKVWNGWKNALLRDLYYAAEAEMGAGQHSQPRHHQQLQFELRQLLPDWQQQMIQEFVSQMETSGAKGLDNETIAAIARLVRELAGSLNPLALHTHSNPSRSITQVMLATPDSTGLFAKTSGVMALAGANIVSAKIFTLKNGTAIQIFNIQDSEQQLFDKPDRLARLSVLLNQALSGELEPANALATLKPAYPSRLEVFKVTPRVNIENTISNEHTVIEVTGRDRIGFLHHVTHHLAKLKLTIATAHITTYGERAVDVFYVKDLFGMKIIHQKKIQDITESLLKAL